MNTFKKWLFLGCWWLVTPLWAQGPLKLEDCKTKARANFPLVKQLGLLEQMKGLSLENLAKGYLPQINLNAQGTYQSEVTSVPISLPNLSIKTLDKDQYRTYVELYQPLIDGRMVKKQQALSKSQFDVEAQKVEVELYKLNATVNQLFFGVLLLETQMESAKSLLAEVDANLKKLTVGVSQGLVNPLNKEVFEAERLKVIQRLEELRYGKKSLLANLEILMGEKLSEELVLEKPLLKELSTQNNRPEWVLFDLQMGQLEQQKELIRNKLSPRLGIMAQLGYGRPALNMLNNDFREYYIGGLKLTWPISSFYTNARERRLVESQQAMVVAQREVFAQQTALGNAQVQRELEKWEALIRTDRELVETRKRVNAAASVQFSQGTLSSLDYLAYLNQLEQANQQLQLHQLQKLQAVYQQQYVFGN